MTLDESNRTWGRSTNYKPEEFEDVKKGFKKKGRTWGPSSVQTKERGNCAERLEQCLFFCMFLFLKPKQKYCLVTPFMLHLNHSTNACSCFSMHALVCSHELFIVGATVILSSEFDLSQMEAVPGPLVL